MLLISTSVDVTSGDAVDGTVSGAEYFVIRITANKGWTGYISEINVSWS